MPLPEQSALELFPDKFVQYSVLSQPGQHSVEPPEVVLVPVDEIDTIEDDRLREALWHQHRHNESETNSVIYTYAKPDHTFYRSNSYPTRLLNRRFTADGVVAVDKSRASQITEQGSVQPSKLGSRVARILRWLSQ